MLFSIRRVFEFVIILVFELPVYFVCIRRSEPITYKCFVPPGGRFRHAVRSFGLYAIPIGNHDRIRVARPSEPQKRRYQRR